MRHFSYAFFTCFTIMLVFSPSGIMAADFPEREIRVIVPTGPGGSIDRMARSVERFLPEIIGVRVIVENRKGAGGTIAIKHFLKQKADGYTIIVLPQPGLTLVRKKAPDLINFDDLSIINVNWIDPSLLVVRKDIGWKSLDDLVTAIRKNPDNYKFGLAGKYSTSPFAAKMLFNKLDLKVREIPYSGGGDSRLALQGGHIDVLAAGAEGMATIKDACTPIGIFWNESNKNWPNVPDINEGLKKYNVKMPDMASIRFFAVHSDVKRKYPQRYQRLVSAWQELMTKHEGFIKFCNDTGVGHDWYGPVRSRELVMDSDRIFSNIKMPKKKK